VDRLVRAAVGVTLLGAIVYLFMNRYLHYDGMYQAACAESRTWCQNADRFYVVWVPMMGDSLVVLGGGLLVMVVIGGIAHWFLDSELAESEPNDDSQDDSVSS
jgi:hypothetical protein